MRAGRFRQTLLVLGSVLVSSWLLYLIWGLAGKAQVAMTEANAARQKYQALEERKGALAADLAALETERGRDAAIRTAFGVARPGEEVIVVVPPSTASPAIAQPWWQWLFSWF